MIEWMLILSGAVNRLVEFIKQSPLWRYIPAQFQSWATLALSLVLGIVAAFLGGANALALVPANEYTAAIPLWAGQIVAGLLIGFGGNVISAIGDFFGTIGQRPPVAPPAATATISGGSPPASVISPSSPPQPEAVG